VTLLIDAGPLVAAADRRDPLARAVQAVLEREAGPLVIPAAVSAEIDFLLGRRLGDASRRAFLDDLAAGRFEVACVEPAEYVTVARLDRRYADLRLGLADLSVVVLAARLQTTRILTFDQRRFRVVTPLQGGAFTLLPGDESR
jgi:predicted nucleic acid-binding protein